MKKLFLAGAVAFFGMAQAQETQTPGFVKGDVFITGAVGYANQERGTEEGNRFTIAPSVGFFVSPNFALGARVGYVNEKFSGNDTEIFENKTETFTVGAFGRYFWTPVNRFSLFGEVNASYGNIKYTNTYDNVSFDSKADGFEMGIAPGINYFITKNFALEATWGVLSYNSIKPDADGAEATENFNVGLDLNDLSLGLVYKF